MNPKLNPSNLTRSAAAVVTTSLLDTSIVVDLNKLTLDLWWTFNNLFVDEEAIVETVIIVVDDEEFVVIVVVAFGFVVIVGGEFEVLKQF